MLLHKDMQCCSFSVLKIEKQVLQDEQNCYFLKPMLPLFSMPWNKYKNNWVFRTLGTLRDELGIITCRKVRQRWSFKQTVKHFTCYQGMLQWSAACLRAVRLSQWTLLKSIYSYHLAEWLKVVCYFGFGILLIWSGRWSELLGTP